MAIKVKTSTPTSAAEGRASATKVPAARAEHPILSLRREVDRLFDDFFRGFPLAPFRWPSFGLEPFERLERGFAELTPTVDVKETENEFRVSAELPGMSEDDIEVVLSDGMLRIKGEKKKEEKKDEGADYHLTERRYGMFQRAFRVPDSVDEGKVEATFRKGVLEVVLPKSAKARERAKKIKVKTG